jgi:transposase
VPGHGARGAPPRLTSAQQQALATQTARGVFRTGDEARQWVTEQFGVAYGYQGMYSLLTRLGGHPKTPRPMAAKADPVAQAAWKKGGSPQRSPRLA